MAALSDLAEKVPPVLAAEEKALRTFRPEAVGEGEAAHYMPGADLVR